MEQTGSSPLILDADPSSSDPLLPTAKEPITRAPRPPLSTLTNFCMLAGAVVAMIQIGEWVMSKPTRVGFDVAIPATNRTSIPRDYQPSSNTNYVSGVIVEGTTQLYLDKDHSQILSPAHPSLNWQPTVRAD